MKNDDIQSFVTMLSILYAGCHAAPGNLKNSVILGVNVWQC